MPARLDKIIEGLMDANYVAPPLAERTVLDDSADRIRAEAHATINKFRAIRLVSLPPIWRVEENYARARDAAILCRSIAVEISAMEVQHFSFASELEALAYQSRQATEVTAVDLKARQAALDASDAFFTELSGNSKDGTDTIHNLANKYREDRPDLVQAARAIASGPNNSPDNPSRTQGAEALLRDSRLLATMQFDSQHALAASSYRRLLIEKENRDVERGVLKRAFDANVTSANAFREKRRRQIKELLGEKGIDLQGRIGSAILRLACEQDVLVMYLRALVDGLKRVYGTNIEEELVDAWKLIAALNVLSEQDLDRTLGLLATTGYVLDQLKSQSAGRVVVREVALQQIGGGDMFTATITVDAATVTGMRMRGISMSLLDAHDSALASVEVNSPEGSGGGVVVGRVLDILVEPTPFIFGSQQYWNRPPAGDWNVAGRQVKLTKDAGQPKRLLVGFHVEKL